MKTKNIFRDVAAMLPPYEKMLSGVPLNISSSATEIRIRAGRPIVIETPNERYFCGSHCASVDEIFECIRIFTDYSIYSCKKELSEGWITLRGGHRVGFSGTAHNKAGIIETINDVSSLNVRISREHKGISQSIYNLTVKNEMFSGLIIAGKPLSGKTTILRDLCRLCGNNFKTALIDERSEIAAVYAGIPQNDIGINTDVLNRYTKYDGINHAMRVLSPEIIICDEIGDECEILQRNSSAGIRFILSVHCGNMYEMRHNKVIKSLISSGIANFIALLDVGKNIGKMKGIWFIEDGESVDICDDGNNLLYNWDNNFSGIENESYSIEKVHRYAGGNECPYSLQSNSHKGFD